LVVNVLVVSNYPELARSEGLKNALQSGEANVSVTNWDSISPSKFNSYDAVVLSGSPTLFSDGGVDSKYRNEIDALRGASVPVLGICFGHQLIGKAFGSEVVNTGKQTRRFVETEVLVDDPLFDGLPKFVSVYESHYEVVVSPPEGFTLLATSPTSPVAAYRKGSIYGIQFHPEVNDAQNPDGKTIIRNFVRSLNKSKLKTRP
jgi:GMP synthase (glutamine-hydrolysing)